MRRVPRHPLNPRNSAGIGPWWWRILQASVVCLLAAVGLPIRGQDRPLRTLDAEVVPVGTLRAQFGFEFLRGIDFPLTGLSGDLTSVGVIGLRLGLARVVEAQLEGSLQNFLRVESRGMPLVSQRYSDRPALHA